MRAGQRKPASAISEQPSMFVFLRSLCLIGEFACTICYFEEYICLHSMLLPVLLAGSPLSLPNYEAHMRIQTEHCIKIIFDVLKKQIKKILLFILFLYFSVKHFNTLSCGYLQKERKGKERK